VSLTTKWCQFIIKNRDRIATVSSSLKFSIAYAAPALPKIPRQFAHPPNLPLKFTYPPFALSSATFQQVYKFSYFVIFDLPELFKLMES